MHIIIRNTGDQPIYEQIYQQIRGEILSGRVKEGAILPSIRALAKDLRISVITTKRAYDELEKDGFIHTIPGKGSYVSRANVQMVREERIRQLEAHVLAALELAPSCGMSTQDVVDMIRMFEKELV